MQSNIFMDSNSLSVLNNHFVGVDRLIDQMIYATTLDSSTSYPPYNIVKTGENTYDVELALAGFGKDDINVEYAENQLTIKSVKKEEKEEKEGVIHKGISKRHFARSFTIAEDVEVKGAELKDGLLTVALERVIPDHKKPRTIKIK